MKQGEKRGDLACKPTFAALCDRYALTPLRIAQLGETAGVSHPYVMNKLYSEEPVARGDAEAVLAVLSAWSPSETYTLDTVAIPTFEEKRS